MAGLREMLHTAESALCRNCGRGCLPRPQNIRLRLPLRRAGYRAAIASSISGEELRLGQQRDTEFVNHQWTHVGRLWTNGNLFLAVDATLRDAWLGFSQDQYTQVAGLG